MQEKMDAVLTVRKDGNRAFFPVRKGRDYEDQLTFFRLFCKKKPDKGPVKKIQSRSGGSPGNF
jgi:hypothetical protein